MSDLIGVPMTTMVKIHHALLNAQENAQLLVDYHGGDKALVNLYTGELKLVEDLLRGMPTVDWEQGVDE